MTSSSPRKVTAPVAWTSKFYEVIGEGHEWPAGPALPSAITSLLGAQSNAINANQMIWSFFKGNPFL